VLQLPPLQEAHPLDAALEAPELLKPKDEIRRSTSPLPQLGQTTSVYFCTSSSNFSPHCLQRNSRKGIVSIPPASILFLIVSQSPANDTGLHHFAPNQPVP